MKRILENIVFILGFIGLPIITSLIVEIISKLITMEMIINTIGILTIISIVYIIKNMEV